MSKIETLYDNLCQTSHAIQLWDLFWRELHFEPRGKSFDKLMDLGFDSIMKLNELSLALEEYCRELKRLKDKSRVKSNARNQKDKKSARS